MKHWIGSLLALVGIDYIGGWCDDNYYDGGCHY
jgi:hypothetical protein